MIKKIEKKYDESLVLFGEEASEKIRTKHIPESQWANELFPLWLNFVHRILIGEGLCGCAKAEECFMDFNEARQKEIGGQIYPFEHILEDFKKAWNQFMNF